MSPVKSRGKLSALNQLMITVGILSAYIVNLAFADFSSGWRLMLGFAAIPAVMLFLGTLFLPESPRWLICKGREEEGLDVLRSLRESSAEIADEISGIKTACMKDSDGFKDLMKKWVRPALVIGVGLAVFQQFMGCNTVIYYVPTIFQLWLGARSAILSTIGIGALNVLITVLALFIMDKIDRRKILIAGSSGMAVSLAALGIMSGMLSDISAASAVYVTLAALCAYIFFFALTWGPVMWIMIGEVFPLKVRGLGAGISSVSNWSANLLVALTFPFFLSKIGNILFLFFAGIAALSILFVKFKVFETRGKTLEEIETSLRTGAAKK
jgi:sugar porter (SP) family MFS transporter